jgi:hypothetical protein
VVRKSKKKQNRGKREDLQENVEACYSIEGKWVKLPEVIWKVKYHFNAKKFKMIDSEQVCKGKVKSTVIEGMK